MKGRTLTTVTPKRSLTSNKRNVRGVNEGPDFEADRHLVHEVVAGHHLHDTRKGAENHRNIEMHATTVHIAKPTGTLNKWNSVADPTNASVNHRQAGSVSTIKLIQDSIQPTHETKTPAGTQQDSRSWMHYFAR